MWNLGESSDEMEKFWDTRNLTIATGRAINHECVCKISFESDGYLLRYLTFSEKNFKSCEMMLGVVQEFSISSMVGGQKHAN